MLVAVVAPELITAWAMRQRKTANEIAERFNEIAKRFKNRRLFSCDLSTIFLTDF